MIGILAFAALLSSAAATPVLSIEDLAQRHAVLDGQLVRVRGYLSACDRQNCVLTSRPLQRDLRAWHSAGGKMMSIGPNGRFDAKTVRFRNRAVVLLARFDDACLDPHTLCLDRAPTLQPVDVQPLIPNKEP